MITMELKGKKALVTGGNSGIGKAAAQLLKEAGAEVMITGRDAQRVKEAANELGVFGQVADVSKLTELGNLAEAVKQHFGQLDVLFVNAGIFKPAPVGSISEAMYDEQMGINFKGAVFSVERLLPLMAEGGAIISLSSVNALAGMPNAGIYAASKAALNAYMRTAAIELAGRGIRVNTINPGPVATPIFGKTGFPKDQLQGFAEAMQNRVPLKRFGQPEEIGRLVVFLASDQASFITGAEINIDGGVSINPILG